MDTVKIFVSYSHQNKDWVDEDGKYNLISWLRRQLEPYDVIFWIDHALKSHIGEDFRRYIKRNIDNADIVVLMISQEFATSEFIISYELPWIKEAFENGEIKIIPLLVTKLSKLGRKNIEWLFDLQTIPSDSIPLIEYSDNDIKWSNMKIEILDVIENEIEIVRNNRLEEETIINNGPFYYKKSPDIQTETSDSIENKTDVINSNQNAKENIIEVINNNQNEEINDVIKYINETVLATPSKKRHRKRNILTSIWIIFLMVANGSLASIFTYFLIKRIDFLFTPLDYLWCTMAAVCCLINLYATIMLWKWLKTGGWLLVISFIITIIIYYSIDRDSMLLIYSIINMGTLLGVLQLKRNHKSCWSLMNNSLKWEENTTMYKYFIIILNLLIIIGCASTYSFNVSKTPSTNTVSNNLSKDEWRKDIAKIMEKATYKYDNGDLYRGETSDSVRNGFGIYLGGTFMYCGGWERGFMNGTGINIVNEGYHVPYCPNCKYYVGYWVSDKKKETGICYDNEGKLIYFGNFDDDKPINTYPSVGDISIYKFECLDYNNGKYIGETKNGLRHGYGIYIWKDGNVLYGNWSEGIQKGESLLFLPDGAVTAKE